MIHLLLPGPLDRTSGGTLYDMRVAGALRDRVRVHALAPRFPHPTPADVAEADAVFSALPDGAVAVVDGLALGVLPEVAARHRDRLRLVALVHHPLALETGLDPATADRYRASERTVLACVRHVIVTSPVTADTLTASYGVDPAAVTAVLPGVDPAPPAVGSGDGTLALLAAGTLIPRKGHDVLLRALAPLADRPWRLIIAGADDVDRETTAALRSLVETLGLTDRVALTGALSRAALDAAYHAADVFVLASHYEGYGMVLSEALARGLPVVSTTGGAIPRTVPEGAGVLVPPGDAAALSAALARVLDDAAVRAALRDGAIAARADLPTWAETAARFAAVLEDLP